MTRNQRVALLGVALVVLVAAFIALRPSDEPDQAATTTTPPPATATRPGATPAPAPPPRPKPKVVVIRGAKPAGGVKTFTWKKGDTIDLIVRSDTADEVHFHGYDVAKDVPAGGSVRFRMKATIDGRFEVELEHRGVLIATVDVRP